MRPAAVDPGGGRESSGGAAGQRAARPGHHGGDAAPEAEVDAHLLLCLQHCCGFVNRVHIAN